MATVGFTGQLASWSMRHRWGVIVGWLVFVVAISGAAGIVGGKFTTDTQFTNEPESQTVRKLFNAYRGAPPLFEQILVQSDTYTVDDPQFAAFVGSLTARLRGHPEAIVPTQVVSYFDTGSAELVSADRRTALIPAQLVGDVDSALDSLRVLEDVIAEFANQPGFSVLYGGAASVNDAFNTAAQEDLAAEIKVIPFALLILILVFGAVVAALLPMGVAFLSIGAATGLVTLISAVYALSTFVTNMISMLGLAVGIDYALFIIARFREQRRLGLSVEDAILTAGETANRAVFFSGLTVVIGLLGLLIVPTSIFGSFAIGASCVVLFAVAASLTLLPAVLRLLGDNIDRIRIGFRPRSAYASGGFWDVVVRVVMRRPLTMAIAATVLLVLLALPMLAMKLNAGGITSLPEHFAVRQAFDVLSDEFSAGRLAPTQVAIRAPDVRAEPVQQALTRVLAVVEANPEIALLAAPEITADGRLIWLSLALQGDAASPEVREMVSRLRDELLPRAMAGSGAEALVGGDAAIVADFLQLVSDYTPIVFAFVLGFAFVLLLLIFRSLIVPLKSIVMNLLSVGASYGVMVMVLQWGWGAEWLGFTQVDAIEAWIPLLMFTILFGLSMDYHIFLLSRIRENFDATGDNRASVAFGLRQTANIITGAAAIMVVVFGGFALGDLPMMQQIGLGLAVSVFLDVTVVRSILVPATMAMLGNWNWYLPRWLHWLPDLRVERDATAVAHAAATTSSAGAIRGKS